MQKHVCRITEFTWSSLGIFIVFTSSKLCVCMLHQYGQHVHGKVVHRAAFLCAGKVPTSGNALMEMLTEKCTRVTFLPADTCTWKAGLTVKRHHSATTQQLNTASQSNAAYFFLSQAEAEAALHQIQPIIWLDTQPEPIRSLGASRSPPVPIRPVPCSIHHVNGCTEGSSQCPNCYSNHETPITVQEPAFGLGRLAAPSLCHGQHLRTLLLLLLLPFRCSLTAKRNSQIQNLFYLMLWGQNKHVPSKIKQWILEPEQQGPDERCAAGHFSISSIIF